MKAILVDDEALALDFLEQQLNKIGNVEVVKKLTHFDIQRDASLLNRVNIVFLDIEMAGANGIELAEKLLEINANLSIVFVTAFQNYAVQAFELNALDYVLKPVQVDRLQKTIERIKTHRSLQMNDPFMTERVLKVNVCRELIFETAENENVFIQWRTTKAQELFLYLLQHRGNTVSKFQLSELLWPDFEQEKAFSQLYTAIYHIRRSLQQFPNHFSLKNVNEGYILHTENVTIDIVEWENAIDRLPASVTMETVGVYESCMGLCKGFYLEEYSYLWAETERYRLEQIWMKVAYQLANYYYGIGDLEKAEKWYIKIEERRPEDEYAYFSLMRLYAKFDYGMLVKHQYEQLNKNLDELNLIISPQIKDWYDDWNKSR